MSDTFTQFEKRLDSLERKHRELAKGYVAKINPDGLITVGPKPNRGFLKLRLFLTLIIGIIFFKAATLAIIGQSTYEDRITALTEGTWFENACAWVMQIDPMTEAVARYFVTTFG